MLKKSRKEIAEEANMAAQEEAATILNSIKYNHVHQSPGSVLDQITFAIGRAVGAGIEVALKNIYTDEEFERDIGLRDDAF